MNFRQSRNGGIILRDLIKGKPGSFSVASNTKTLRLIDSPLDRKDGANSPDISVSSKSNSTGLFKKKKKKGFYKS